MIKRSARIMPFAFLMAASVFALALPATDALSEDATAGKQAAASDLVKAMGGLKQARKTIAQLKTGMIADVTRRAPDIAPAFTAFVEKELAPDSKRVTAYLKDMEGIAVKFYVDNFSSDEMKQIADFQRTEAGMKFQRQAPQLLQIMTPRMMQFQQELLRDVKGNQKAPAASDKK